MLTLLTLRPSWGTFTEPAGVVVTVAGSHCHLTLLVPPPACTVPLQVFQGSRHAYFPVQGRSPGAAVAVRSPSGSFGTPRSPSASRLQTAVSGAPSSPAASQASMSAAAFAELTTPAALQTAQV